MNRRNFGPIFSATGLAWLLLLLVLILNFTIRWRLRDLPLERDEGEYAYAGQLLLQHVSPYDHAYNTALKLPGTFFGYALIMAVFGQTTGAIHVGIMLITLASTVLVFVLARRISGDMAGVVGAGTYVLLSNNPATLGLAAHGTHFVMLPALAGVVLLQNLDDKTSAGRIFFAGLCLGLAILMKQTGAPFAIFGACWILRHELLGAPPQWRRLVGRLGWLAGGGFLPLALTCAVITLAGDFGQFWFWTFRYAWNHEAIFTFGSGLQNMLVNVLIQFAAAPGLWGLAISGLLAVCFVPAIRPWRCFIASFFLLSFLAVCPGWYFRGHYFIQLVPSAALCTAVAFRVVADFIVRQKISISPVVIPSVIFGAAAASSLVQWNDLYFFSAPTQASREIYGTNPFPEAANVSHYIADHSAPSDQIAVLGSEPEIYFYSRRRSASGYICTYPLVEPQPFALGMQNEMTRQIEKARPSFVVLINIQGSWEQSTARVTNNIFGWWTGYSQNYQLVGMVDIFEDQPSEFFWNKQLSNRTNTLPVDISIYQRK